MPTVGRNAIWTAALLSVFALSAAGCLATVADSPLADGAPDTTAHAYIPVHGVPLDRIEPTMDPGQRAKIQAELIAARDRQASAADVAAAASKNPAAKIR